jgi:hypothetical protein
MVLRTVEAIELKESAITCSRRYGSQAMVASMAEMHPGASDPSAAASLLFAISPGSKITISESTSLENNAKTKRLRSRDEEIECIFVLAESVHAGEKKITVAESSLISMSSSSCRLMLIELQDFWTPPPGKLSGCRSS